MSVNTSSRTPGPGLLAAAVVLLAAAGLAQGTDKPSPVSEFWKHWGDGKGELAGYRLVQPRYGAPRKGTAVLIFVTEDFSESARVKADPGRHPKEDVFPVLKLNAVRHFQTGIYDYDVMTSTFARVQPGWPVAKVSFSSQEWCGHVYHQLLPRGGRIQGALHSYFDGEADATEELPLMKDGLFEDALPIVLRGWLGELMPRGQSRRVPLLPALLGRRLQHQPLAWTTATISRAAATASVTVPAGRFEVDVWTVVSEGGARTTYRIEAAAPFRIVQWEGDDGEKAELLGSERVAYWKLNAPGGESALKSLGLAPE